MSSPQNNGHQLPSEPQIPQPHPEARFQAMQARIDKLRNDVAEAESIADRVNALYITEQAQTLSLAQENSALKQKIIELEEQLAAQQPLPGTEPAPAGATES